MRDRLIELKRQAVNYAQEKADERGGLVCIDDEVDYLLANGVIVPPCKVGDKLYIVADVSKAIVESVVMGVWIIEDSISILTIHGVIINDSFGKTVFLTKEEAEEKLKELGK